MAKKGTRNTGGSRQEGPPASQTAATRIEGKIEEFSADLGRLLKSAREKADGWFGQRQTVTDHLTEIRDTATELLSKLGAGGWIASRKGRGNGRRKAASGGRRTGSSRKAQRVADSSEPAAATPKKRIMSPEARKAISDAQKARWARHRRGIKTAR